MYMCLLDPEKCAKFGCYQKKALILYINEIRQVLNMKFSCILDSKNEIYNNDFMIKILIFIQWMNVQKVKKKISKDVTMPLFINFIKNIHKYMYIYNHKGLLPFKNCTVYNIFLNGSDRAPLRYSNISDMNVCMSTRFWSLCTNIIQHSIVKMTDLSPTDPRQR